MKDKKRQGLLPKWTPYPIQGMTPGEVAPLLWKQKVIRTIPGTDTQAMEYGIAVMMDEESREPLGTQYTWLTLIWLLEQQQMGIRKNTSAGAYGISTQWIWAPTAICKVMIHGIDDTHYGVCLTRRTYRDFVETWYALRAFLWINGAREHGLNGTQLVEYCERTLGGYERDYN